MNRSHISRAHLAPIVRQAQGVDGFLTPREAEFLALIAACPTTSGCIVELGTLFGKSAVALAQGARLADRALVHSVDLKLRPEVEPNLKRCGVWDQIRLHCLPSHMFWQSFHEPIRFLWHDGANDRDYVASDVASALPLLSDRAIVAFHDVLNCSGERLHSFVDHVLSRSEFGQAGIVGSIGWAQVRKSGATLDEARYKERLATRLTRLKPFHVMGSARTKGLRRVVYETYRQLIPHGAINIHNWLSRVA